MGKRTRQVLIERELTGEGPTPARSRNDRGAESDTGAARAAGRTVTVNQAESPITWLHARGHLPDRLFDAAERLRADYERAQLAPSITMRWDPVRITGGIDAGLTPSERQLAAKRRFDAALHAAGSGLADVLWRVVCDGQSLPQAERALAWPARSGKLVLRLALERVADFYRLPGSQ